MHGHSVVRALAIAAALAAAPIAAHAAAGLGAAVELVDPKVFRVCADPNNMPFSNEKQEGYEQKLAELLAAKLGKTVSYTYFPQVTGFVRHTLGEIKCDVIMSYAQGDTLVQNTNAYYSTAYALVFKPGTGLDDVQSLADPRLKEKIIGIVARTPPATNMAMNGLMGKARPYPLFVDTRLGTSAEAMIKDLQASEIDVAVLWGPLAGWYAKQANPPLTVVPLLQEKSGSKMVFRITMGVRPSDQEWKRELNKLIQENQGDIDKILNNFGVPLIDEQGHWIGH
jgi:quinoprotein dehydrogenase-associated probable ABC transporter substrate-binding protein